MMSALSPVPNLLPDANIAGETKSPPRLLIVDDVADNRIVLARRFQRRGFEIVEAEDGLQALRLIAEQTFDVVLLDSMMPGIDGPEVLRRIRVERSAAVLPVIMVTAKTESENIVDSLQLGANDYITKPVDFAVALARVTKQVAHRRAELELLVANDALGHAKVQLEKRVFERSAQLIEANATIQEEVARRLATEDRIAYLAHHDTLTGLANRFHFESTLQSIASRKREAKLGYAVLFIDLDGFKNINDTLGHSVGDALLREVATRVRANLRPEDFVARFGGDEFAILHVSVDVEASSIALARRLIEVISGCHVVDGHQVFIGASIGIALADKEMVDPITLMKRADLAMYRAKTGGRGQYWLFHPDMDTVAQARRTLDLALRGALANGDFELFYQPIVNLGERRLSGFEALLRWRHPERGLLSPVEFIDLAEETGLIIPMGEWVLRRACVEAMRWPADLRVAVNLSAIQFRDKNLVALVKGALKASGLSPDRLELEITESVLLGNDPKTYAMLGDLRELGVRISLDDFGIGYSGLGYLRSFQFDKVKIDKSLVQEMSSKEVSLAIVQAAVSIGASLGLTTTGEGVETADQLQDLSFEGCTEVQGFLFGVPQPAEQVPEMIEKVFRMSYIIGASPPSSAKVANASEAGRSLRDPLAIAANQRLR
jgi:diguanylate cyclase (GGDEF)-like protein